MKILGIHVAKAQLRSAVLSGSKASPVLVEKNRLVTPDPARIPELMDWYETQFKSLIDRLEPDRIAYRMTLDPGKEQIITAEFPLAILNLLAHRSRLPIVGYTAPSFVASKLGLPKGSDLSQACDDTFGDNPPYWDTNQKHAVLVAWFTLP